MENKLRIIAGELKNRIIKVPKHTETRPALILVRRMICDTLTPFILDAKVLDLFAGTGAFVFELISRGASRAVAVDLEKKMADSILANARAFGVEDRITIVNNDYLKAIDNLGAGGDKYDIIIVAPPFYGYHVNYAIAAIYDRGLLAKDGFIVAHYFKKDDVNREPEGFTIWKTKTHGKSVIDFFRPSE
jgi:16S rRNA (guanine966-N2)-methyltransferase